VAAPCNGVVIALAGGQDKKIEEKKASENDVAG